MKTKLLFGLLLLAMILPAWELPVKIDGSAGSHYFTQVRFDSTPDRLHPVHRRPACNVRPL